MGMLVVMSVELLMMALMDHKRINTMEGWLGLLLACLMDNYWLENM